LLACFACCLWLRLPWAAVRGLCSFAFRALVSSCSDVCPLCWLPRRLVYVRHVRILDSKKNAFCVTGHARSRHTTNGFGLGSVDRRASIARLAPGAGSTLTGTSGGFPQPTPRNAAARHETSREGGNCNGPCPFLTSAATSCYMQPYNAAAAAASSTATPAAPLHLLLTAIATGKWPAWRMIQIQEVNQLCTDTAHVAVCQSVLRCNNNSASGSVPVHRHTHCATQTTACVCMPSPIVAGMVNQGRGHSHD
jgi:hypothetical protein